MSRVIWKYEVHPGEFTVDMPLDAQILDVQVQGTKVQMWALVDPDKPKQVRNFYCAGTGYNLDINAELQYVGTVQLLDLELVYHLFWY